MAENTEYDYKMRFAALLQRVAKNRRSQFASQVAKEVVGLDAVKYPMFVFQIADEWLFDPIVIEEMDRLDLIPKTKEETLQQVWSEAVDRTLEARERLVALRLYADINNWTLRQTTTLKDDGAKGVITNEERELITSVMNPIDTVSA